MSKNILDMPVHTIEQMIPFQAPGKMRREMIRKVLQAKKDAKNKK